MSRSLQMMKDEEKEIYMIIIVAKNLIKESNISITNMKKRNKEKIA